MTKNKVKEIHLDFENRTVSWKSNSIDIIFARYDKSTAYSILNHLRPQLNLPYKNKDAYKQIVEKTGYTAKYISKCMNWGCYEVFIKPVEKYVNDYGYSYYKGRISYKIEKIWKTKYILDQNKEDGIENISPFCFEHGKTPQELKEAYGKSLWKKFTKNSKYRNKILAKHFPPNPKYIRYQFELPLLSQIEKIPSINFWKMGVNSYALYMWKHKIPKSDWERVKMEISDLQGIPSKRWINWSPRRVHEEHENLMQGQINRRLKNKSPETFEIFNKNSDCPKDFEFEGFEATLLKSPLDLAKEGIEMRHCVGSYDYNVKNGQYIVYSISGPKRSTLSLNLSSKIQEIPNYQDVCLQPINEWGHVCKVDQHYGHCNSKVSNKSKEIAEKIKEEWQKYLTQRRCDKTNIDATLNAF